MKFHAPPRRRTSENLVPMINVVFLLLIFFLMTAQIAPPEPFAVTPPSSDSDLRAEGEFALFLDAEGQLGYLEHLGDGALKALTADRAAWCAARDCVADQPPVTLRADGQVSAAHLAALLPRLGAMGFAQVHLVTRTP